MSIFQIGRDAIDLAETVYQHGTVGQWGKEFLQRYQTTHGKDAINKISTQVGSAMAAPLAVAGGISRNEGVMNTLKNVYGTLENPNVANIAGSAFTAGVSAGVLNGLTHDSTGNTDIAGIPMI